MVVVRRSVREEEWAAGKHPLSISQRALRAVHRVEARPEGTVQVTHCHRGVEGCPLAAPVALGAGDGSCSAAGHDHGAASIENA